MPFYQKRGKVPNKRHTQFRDESGKLYSEELVSRNGFSGIYSNLYHINPPAAVQSIGDFRVIELSKKNVNQQKEGQMPANATCARPAIAGRISKRGVQIFRDGFLRPGTRDE